MSIQQCYNSFFPSIDFILNEYRIYSSLVYYGYIVRRKQFNLRNKSKLVDKIDFERNENFKHINEPIINKNEYGKLSKKEILHKLDDLIPNITISDLKKKFKLK